MSDRSLATATKEERAFAFKGKKDVKKAGEKV